jgi:superfamily II DNA or RNA helicase
VANAHRMAEIFERYRPGSAKAVDGETPSDERRRILEGHKAGEYQFLCNVGVLTEGYDDPAVSCIGMARPTKSRALYAQMAGRGFRICPGKDKLLLLDFVGNTGRHRLITGADILDGKYGDDVTAKAREISERDGQIDAVEALEKAAAELEEARQREAARRAKIQGKVRYSSKTVDPFEVLHIDRSDQDGWDERFGLTATEKQRETLTKAGIDVDADCSRARASKLIGSIFKRRELGLASFKQLKTLQRYGIQQINVGFRQASKVIDAIAANSWKPLPPGQLQALLQRDPGQEG